MPDRCIIGSILSKFLSSYRSIIPFLSPKYWECYKNSQSTNKYHKPIVYVRFIMHLIYYLTISTIPIDSVVSSPTFSIC